MIALYRSLFQGLGMFPNETDGWRRCGKCGLPNTLGCPYQNLRGLQV
jgi:hypothetical protein